MTITFCRTREARQITGLSSTSLQRARTSGELQEGLHWHRAGTKQVLYSRPLIVHWAATRTDPDLHKQAIARYLSAVDALV